MSVSLRFTETNSADDSKGRTWGLDGNLFWYVIGGAFAAVMIFLGAFSALGWSASSSAITAAIPLLLSLIYVLAFRQGKPPGYDRDLLQTILGGGRSFAPAPLSRQPQHPTRHDA